MEDFIPGWLNPGQNSTVFIWRDSSREEWNLQTELSCSVHPGLSLLREFILENAFVSEKGGKIVNFKEHGIWPWWEPRKVWIMLKIWSRFSQYFPCSSRDENNCVFTWRIVHRNTHFHSGTTFITGSSCKRMYVYVYDQVELSPGQIPGWNRPCTRTLREREREREREWEREGERVRESEW